MKRIIEMISLLCVIGAILSGCTKEIRHELPINGEMKIDINIHPALTAGIPLRDYSKDQEGVAIMHDFLLNARCNENSIRFEVVGIDADWNTFPGVLFTELSEKTPDNRFYGHFKVQTPLRKGVKILIIDVGGRMGFDALGNFVSVLFKDQLVSEKYRKELYEKISPSSELSEIPDPKEFDDIIRKWNKRRIPIRDVGFKIITPVSKETLSSLCKINTAETALDRAGSRSWGVYFPNLPGSGIGLGVDTLYTIFGPYRGCGKSLYPDKDESQLSQMLLEDARERAVVRVYRKEN